MTPTPRAVMLSSPVEPDPLPLVVDVDGTLVSGDLLIEGVARLLVANPLTVFALPLWLARGRARLKRMVAEAVSLPPETLALNATVLDEIQAAKASGRAIYLASGSDALAVAPLAARVGADGYFASDGHINLVGHAKAERLAARFASGFDYVGDARCDLAVWQRARHAIGVNLSPSVKHKLRALHADARFIDNVEGTRAVLRALRPHQWVKNILVFTPLVAAHETSAAAYLAVAGVFAALSACASGVYVLNDVADLPHDRRHARKRHRPIAAGQVRLLPMIGLGAALIAAGVALAFSLSMMTGAWVLFYLGAALAYSLWVKRLLFADVVLLALLHTVRVLAGAAAISIVPSGWFLAFAIFIFLALAIIKRQAELRELRQANVRGTDVPHGRGYSAEDLDVLVAMGVVSGFTSVLVLMLYIRSTEVVALYTSPEWLWVLCPLLIYYLGRMVLLAHRGAVGDDPVIFVLRDRVSWLCIGAALVIMYLAL